MRMAATDLGFRRNASALVLMRVEGRRLIVDEAVELLPGETPLVPSEVCREFCERAESYGAQSIAGDVHYKDTALEYVREYGLAWRDIPAQERQAMYTWARVLVRERRVEFRGVQNLIEQLASTRVQFGAGGSMSVTFDGAGSSMGRHGDLVSAFVGGAYLLRQQLQNSGGTRLMGDPRRTAMAERESLQDWL